MWKIQTFQKQKFFSSTNFFLFYKKNSKRFGVIRSPSSVVDFIDFTILFFLFVCFFFQIPVKFYPQQCGIYSQFWDFEVYIYEVVLYLIIFVSLSSTRFSTIVFRFVVQCFYLLLFSTLKIWNNIIFLNLGALSWWENWNNSLRDCW